MFSPEDYTNSITRDYSVMRLAHPLRAPAADPVLLSGVPEIVGQSCWARMREAFQNDDELTGSIISRLIRDPSNRRLWELIAASSAMPGGTEVGNFYGHIVVLRNHVKPSAYFRLDDALCQALLKTDISEDIPLEALAVPFSRFYIEFGTARNLGLFVPNEMSGLHEVEGAYVESGHRDDGSKGLYIVFTGSPLGKRNALDDATSSVYLEQSEGATVVGALTSSYETALAHAGSGGFRAPGADSVPYALELLKFLAKALLYISVPDCRRSVHAERTQALKALAAIKSTAKRNKAQRKLNGLTDYILVHAPADFQQEFTSEQSNKSVKTHWRRGHYRMQPHGQDRALRKLLFIRPTLVKADLGLAESSAPRYVVR